MMTVGVLMLDPQPQHEVDVDVLTEVIYFEARDQITAGQIAVANVVLNRVADHRYPDTIEDVAHQWKWSNGKKVCQFSYWCDGKADSMIDRKAEARARQIATDVYSGRIPDITDGSTHYYAHDLVSPDWGLTILGKIGDHTFERWEK